MSDDARLASLGYQPQLNRVLGLFANFSVAFTYLSPMVGIYSLFALGVARGRTGVRVADLDPGRSGCCSWRWCSASWPATTRWPGALYQYSKFSVGPSYGWFVGWFYGIALLITVAAVDTGVVGYVDRADAQLVRLEPRPDRPPDDPGDHRRACWSSRPILNITGARVMGRVAQFGVYVEIVGTLGIAMILAIDGFHHGLGLPVLHPGRAARRRATRSGSTSAATG